MTKEYKINIDNFTADELAEAADILKNNGTVAFPTETVYGLGANALSGEAVKKIFIAKGRPSDNPLIVHIADISGIYPLVTEFNDRAKTLAENFWPGPLTMVLPASELIPKEVTGGLSTVAIRIPDHPVALMLLQLAGIPIAAPSANTSGGPSPTTPEHVLSDLRGKVDAVVAGGESSLGVESTVLDLTTEPPVILRPGGITREMLEEVIGKVKVDSAISASQDPRSPGMKYTHYSPHGETFLVTEHGKNLARKLDVLLNVNRKHELRTAFLITAEAVQYLKAKPELLWEFTDLDNVAHNLYTALRECDEQNIDAIYCETFTNKGIGLAVMNRLRKAAGGKVI